MRRRLRAGAAVGLRRMTGAAWLHIVGVAAVWTLTMFSVRLAIASFRWLSPLAAAILHPGRRDGRVGDALRVLHAELIWSLATRWSAPLLFAGGGLVGLGYLLGCLGDIALLVSPPPARWDGVDGILDCIAAVSAAAGMAALQAATALRRAVSLHVGAAFAISGIGIGVATI